jgi:hypothetical protein
MKSLFAEHEKKYFGFRNPKHLSPSKGSATITISSVYGKDKGANEQFFWGDHEAAFNRAKEYLITPVVIEVKSRYRLEWK